MLVFSISIVILIFSVFVFYSLILAFIGVSKPFKEMILPVIIMSVITYISRSGFHFSTTIHTLVNMSMCIIFTKVFNRELSWMLSALGSFLTLVVFAFAGFLWPFLNYLVRAIPNEVKPNSWEFVYFSLAEILLPVIVLLILKAKKISLMKYVGK